MSKIRNAIYEIHHIDAVAERNQWVNRLHPLIKFVLTFVYIIMVVSMNRYDIIRLAGMAVYPIALFILADLSFCGSLKRLRVVLPLVCFIGIFNPLFDRVPAEIFGIRMNAGVLSMITLMMKGILTVLASYLLIATTTIEKLCYALRLIHIPPMIVTQVMLTYRYVTILLEEVNRITQAYSLRAPRQKGIHFKVWGSLTGQLLIRSMDRAGVVYESMTLRGYDGTFDYVGEKIIWKWQDIFYFVFWFGVFLLFRNVPILIIVGNFVGGLLV